MHDYAYYQDKKHDIKIVRHPKTGKPILARELEESLKLGKEAEISYGERRVQDGAATLLEIVEEQNESFDENKANDMALRQSTNQRLMQRIKNTTGKKIVKIIKKVRKKAESTLSVRTSVEMAELKSKNKFKELNEDTDDATPLAERNKSPLSRQATALEKKEGSALGFYDNDSVQEEENDPEALEKATQILNLLRAVIILDDLSTKRENYSFFADLVKRMKASDIKRREDAIKKQ